MILNLRGSYGAGKTTIFRRLIDEHEHSAIYAVNVRQENDRRVPIVWKVGDAYLLGRYRVGSDGIRHRPLAELIRLFADHGSVLYENVLVSANYQMWKKLRDELFPTDDLLLALLDTTEDECVASVQRRRADAAARGWKHRQETVNEKAARGHWKYVQKTTANWATLGGERVEIWARDDGYDRTVAALGAMMIELDPAVTSPCNHYDGECGCPLERRLPSTGFTRRPFPPTSGLAELDILMRQRLAPQGPVTNCGHVRGGLDSYSLPRSSTPDFRYCRHCIEWALPLYGCDRCGAAFNGTPPVTHVITATTWGGKAIEDHFLGCLCAECAGASAVDQQYGVNLEWFDRGTRAEFMVTDARTVIGPLPMLEYTEKQASKLAARLTSVPA